MEASDVIRRTVCADFVRNKNDRRPVMIELSYDITDPYAIRFAVSTGDAPDQWAVGRDLLSEGLTRPVGEGEARVWPSQFGPRPVLWIQFGRRQRTALIELMADDLQEFIDESYKLVPIGTEPLQVDMDTLLKELIRDAS
jgi:hypothetical protein